MKFAQIFLLAASPSMLVGTGYAQSIPGAVLPGQIERQFQYLPQPRATPSLPALPVPKLTIPTGADSVQFQLDRVELDGLTITPSAGFNDLLKVEPGRELTLAGLYALADRLTARLRGEGFLLARVIVPPQSIENGVARLRVIEGGIANVNLSGAASGQDALIRAFADKIRVTRPLTAAALERYMLLINDLPGVFASATLSPAQTEVGSADLLIQVKRKKWSASLAADNRGGGYLGDYRLIGDAAVTDMLRAGQNSAIKLALSPGGELAYLAVQHEEALGSEGGRLGFSLSATRAEPKDRTFVPLALETRSQALSLTYNHPLLRSRSHNLNLRAGLYLHDGEESVFGVKDRQDKLRSLRLGVTWDVRDAWRGSNLFDLEWSRGLRSLGASDNSDAMLTRSDGRIDYSKINLFAARVQDFSGDWSILAALSGQYALDKLLASELYGFGGDPLGRGYDPSELVGDHGLGFKLELRHDARLPWAAEQPLQLYGFYDAGKVWQRTGGSDSATSTGVGARFGLNRETSLSLELAKPLTHAVAAEDNKSLRGYVGLSARF